MVSKDRKGLNTKVYVFDFYNLYIQKGEKYINKDLGIRLVPLEFAEKFEKERTSLSKPYRYGQWKTAKCYIKAKSLDDAKRYADWLEFIYSFAQSRCIIYDKAYEFKKGKKYPFSDSKFPEPIENRFSELVYGIKTNGPFFTRDLTEFVDKALTTLISTDNKKRGDITCYSCLSHIKI